MSAGILYAIGVGPGAPDLLTLRAAAILRSIDVALCASSNKNDYSLALNIASQHLKSAAKTVKLDFPMTRDKEELSRAWKKAAQITLAYLNEGYSVAFLTLGDPLIYSTFGYLKEELAQIAPKLRFEIVPGITSFQAAAAKAGLSLCEADESVAIIPGTLPEADLACKIAKSDTACILKVYRNYEAICGALKKENRGEDCLLASFIEQPSERISSILPESRPPYMSLIISKKAK